MKQQVERAGCPDKAVIFDLDGVLTDTAEYHYQAWLTMAKEEGFPFDRKANEELRGISRLESLKKILQGRSLSEAKMQELMTRKNNYYRKMISNMNEKDLLPGAEKLLLRLRQRGIKVALASASKNARDVVSNLGIAHFFDFLADGGSVSKTKPAPDLFHYVACRLEIEPEQCIVVEDAASGIAAAHEAGMVAVGIGPTERVGEAELVYSSVADIDLDRMLDLLSGKPESR